MVESALKTLLAIKIVALQSELKPHDRIVCCGLLDHYNRRSGQCDPSIGRLARLTALSKRTVIAQSKIIAAQIITRIRHGGRSSRNRYLPNWSRLEFLEREYRSRFRNARVTRPDDVACQTRCADGDHAVIQTYKSNLSTSTYGQTNGEEEHSNAALLQRSKTAYLPVGSRITAAQAAARRRWEADVREGAASAEQYGKIVEAIDLQLADAATAAELRGRGAGAADVLMELRRRASVSPASFDESGK